MVNCRYAYVHPRRKWQICCSNQARTRGKRYNVECYPSRCGHKKPKVLTKRQKQMKKYNKKVQNRIKRKKDIGWGW